VILTQGIVPTVTRTGVGQYDFAFDGTGPGCALPHLTLSFAAGFVTYGGGFCTDNHTETHISTYSASGASADIPFTYLVIGAQAASGGPAASRLAVKQEIPAAPQP